MTTLRVSSKFPDEILLEVQEQVAKPPRTAFTLVTGPVEFAKDVLATGQTELDLVGHSSGDDFLLFLGHAPGANVAQWLVADDNADWMAALKAAALGGVSELRILGCVTAWSQRGRDTMEEIQHLLALAEVWASKDWLVRDDFDATGFRSPQKLVSLSDIKAKKWSPGPELPPPPQQAQLFLGDALAVRGLELSALEGGPIAPPWKRVKLTEFEAADFVDLVGGAEKMNRKGGLARGLLALPTAEYWVPAPGGGFRVVRSLCNWRFIAMSADLPGGRPDETAAMFRVASPDRLKVRMEGFAHEDVPLPP